MDTTTDTPLRSSTPAGVAPRPVARPTPGLGAELRESLVLLGCAVLVTVGLTTAAQAALTTFS